MPKSRARVASSKIRIFDGVGGPENQVLRRWNEKGWDISNTIANVAEDVDLTEGGTLRQRPGRGRALSGSVSEDSIESIFGINFTGIRHAGIVAGGSLSIAELSDL